MVMRALLLLLLGVCIASATDLFQQVDKNVDGQIDRTEFKGYLNSIHAALDPLVDMSAVSSEPDVVGSLADGGGDAAWVRQVLSMTNEGDFISSFCNSLAVILVTEIGDKTFFIAAVLAMRNGRFVVYLGAMGALAVMHVLSSLMGIALPAFLPRKYTHYASAFLFLYFGLRLLKEASEKGEGPSEELQEVEEELIEKKVEREEGDAHLDAEADAALTDAEEGGKGHQKAYANAAALSLNLLFANPSQFVHNLVVVLNLADAKNMAVFMQAFTLTFLAEWGDRSQIATIALASVKNAYGVILGGLLGHAFCTGVAVVGGRLLAARISERTVAIIGGISFLGFGIHAFVAGP